MAATAGASLSQVRSIAYEYDPYEGYVTREIHSDGRTVTYQYEQSNAFGTRLARTEVTQDGVIVYWRNLEYDPVTGRVASESTPEGTIHREHDDFGRLARMHNTAGQDLRYTYDALGNSRPSAARSWRLRPARP